MIFVWMFVRNWLACNIYHRTAGKTESRVENFRPFFGFWFPCCFLFTRLSVRAVVMHRHFSLPNLVNIFLLYIEFLEMPNLFVSHSTAVKRTNHNMAWLHTCLISAFILSVRWDVPSRATFIKTTLPFKIDKLSLSKTNLFRLLMGSAVIQN